MKERNYWLPSWFGKEQNQAWAELPTLNGKVAPHTWQFYEAYQEWYRKWGKKFPRPCIVEDYKELKRQRDKHLHGESTGGN